MDGIEATEHIRRYGELQQHYKNSPIVALTANTAAGVRELFMQHGFADFMSKPIDSVLLHNVLKKWIPKNKQEGSIETEPQDILSEPSIDMIELEGVDVAKGIRLSGGTVEHYVEILAIFHEDGLQNKITIEESTTSGDIRAFTICVHALKGALANIGAEKLSEEAYALEKAGQRDDMGYIEKNSRQFLKKLDKLLNEISTIISSDKIKQQSGSLLSELLLTELTNLKTALENMNAFEINKSIDSMLVLECTDEVKSILRNISKHILMVEYEQATSLIDSLLYPSSNT